VNSLAVGGIPGGRDQSPENRMDQIKEHLLAGNVVFYGWVYIHHRRILRQDVGMDWRAREWHEDSAEAALYMYRQNAKLLRELRENRRLAA
jgi:hypothetical protein